MPAEAGTHERRLRHHPVVQRQVALGVEGVQPGLRGARRGSAASRVTGDAKLPLVTIRGWGRPRACTARAALSIDSMRMAPSLSGALDDQAQPPPERRRSRRPPPTAAAGSSGRPRARRRRGARRPPGRRSRRPCRPAGRRAGPAAPSSPSAAWRPACTSRAGSRTRTARPSACGRRPAGRAGTAARPALEASRSSRYAGSTRHVPRTPSTTAASPDRADVVGLVRRHARPCRGRCPSAAADARRGSAAPPRRAPAASSG